MEINDSPQDIKDVFHVVKVDAPIANIDVLNGIRSVNAKGKPSTSLFRFLDYDAKNDTSLISCCPVTGRGHQLRVHLQWLGFPICNDEIYGGRSHHTRPRSPVEKSISTILESTFTEKIVTYRVPYTLSCYDGCEKLQEYPKTREISEDEVAATKKACLCCKGNSGILKHFSESQLLLSGHEIDLCAVKYCINFDKQIKTKKFSYNANVTSGLIQSLEASEDISRAIEIEIEIPPWAKTFGNISLIPINTSLCNV